MESPGKAEGCTGKTLSGAIRYLLKPGKALPQAQLSEGTPPTRGREPGPYTHARFSPKSGSSFT